MTNAESVQKLKNTYEQNPSDLELNQRAHARREAFKDKKRERKGFIRTSLAIGALSLGFGAEEAITNNYDKNHYNTKTVHVGNNESTFNVVKEAIGPNDNVLEEMHRLKEEYGSTDLQGRDIVVHDD